jgi:AraC family transcriptional regulator of adaptative response/methylated-DNA-[protein]-cysteine methyltransferase
MKKIKQTEMDRVSKEEWQDERRRWAAVQNRDLRADQMFVFAVRSTGIYCRPSCPARRPKRENVIFYSSAEAAEKAGFRPCRRCRPRELSTTAAIARRVCAIIEDRLPEQMDLEALGLEVGMSPFHLQRVFKRALGISPRDYADVCRFGNLKRNLKQHSSVTDALYAAGYGSSSRAYERTGSRLGMTPGRYRRGGERTRIHYAVVGCALGRLLVAATEKGLCAVSIGDRDSELEGALRAEFPSAEIRPDLKKLKAWTRALRQHVRDTRRRLDLPLDVQATAFQWRVWKALREIPCGQTRSYSEVARSISKPKAVRAVARACAANPVALLTPCHRVVRQDGTLGGYRWGPKRKRALLEQESTQPSAPRGEDGG